MKTTDEVIKNITRNLRFHFQIENNSSEDKRIAILPSYFGCTGIITNPQINSLEVITNLVVDESGKINTSTSTLEYLTGVTVHSTKQVLENMRNAGYSVDAILTDGELCENVTARTINASKTSSIADFQRYIRTNEWHLDTMTIASDNPEAYDCDMEYAQLTPFKQQALNSFETGCHYTVDQENNDKIDIDFAEGEFILNDTLLWIVTIPAETIVKYTLRF